VLGGGGEHGEEAVPGRPGAHHGLLFDLGEVVGPGIDVKLVTLDSLIFDKFRGLFVTIQ
jgi:hypothetical protein